MALQQHLLAIGQCLLVDCTYSEFCFEIFRLLRLSLFSLAHMRYCNGDLRIRNETAPSDYLEAFDMNNLAQPAFVRQLNVSMRAHIGAGGTTGVYDYYVFGLGLYVCLLWI